jgi:hypothetical protein
MPHAAQMEEIRAPLRVIDQLNAAKGVAVSDPADVEAHFRTALDGRWGDVPLLNAVSHVEEIPAGSLVRFRCMVQNMYNPEWYVGQYMASNTQTGEQIQGTAQYRESLDVPAGFTPDMQAASKSAQERVPLHCMSIPHESAWVMENETTAPAAAVEPRVRVGKRGLDDDAMQEDASPAQAPSAAAAPAACMQVEDGADAEAKRVRVQAAHVDAAPACGADAAGTAARPPLVAGAAPRHAAIVKVYGAAAAGKEALKMNEAVEVVGILTLDPAAATFADDDAEARAADPSDLLTPAPPPSSVLPRIHALTHRKLTIRWNPALEAAGPAARAAREAQVTAAASAARARIIDRLAASEFLQGVRAPAPTRRAPGASDAPDAPAAPCRRGPLTAPPTRQVTRSRPSGSCSRRSRASSTAQTTRPSARSPSRCAPIHAR